MIAYTSAFAFFCFYGNQWLLSKLATRQARIEGRLDEHLAEQEAYREKGLGRRVFGKIGGGGEDQTDGGIASTTLGGAWTLRDLDGKRFGSADLEGHYYLLFFGGTLCPDICPLTLMKIMKALKLIQRKSEGK